MIGSSDLELGAWTQPSDRDNIHRHPDRAGQVRNMEVEFLRPPESANPDLISAALISLDRSRAWSPTFAISRSKTDRKRAAAAREELSRQVEALSESEDDFPQTV